MKLSYPTAGTPDLKQRQARRRWIRRIGITIKKVQPNGRT